MSPSWGLFFFEEGVNIIVQDQKIIIKWGAKNRKYYEDLGYKFSNMGDEFEGSVNDLPHTSQQAVKIECDYCHNIINVKYSYYLKTVEKYGDYACIHCSKNRTLGQRREKIYNEFLEFCEKHDYLPVTKKEEISNNEGKITYICKKHGERSITIKGMQADHTCYLCTRSLLTDRWNANLEERQIDIFNKLLTLCDEAGYTLLSDLNDISKTNDYIEYECPKHGIHKMKINNFFAGKRCPECSYEKSREKHKLPIAEVIRRIEKCGGHINNPEDYVNQSEKNLYITCIKCGNPFLTSLTLFTQHHGQTCPDCSNRESNGEIAVRKYLENNNIKYEPYKWFSNCRDVKPLPFDFYLPDCNTVIEFDGQQHYCDTHYFSNFSFGKNLIHDQIKTDYCKDNNINLIRIPYWNIDKVDEILDEKLL